MQASLALCAVIGVLAPARVNPPQRPSQPRVNVSFTDIANTQSSEFDDFDTHPKINNSGVVVFEAQRNIKFGGRRGIYKATDIHHTTTIALAHLETFLSYGINNRGGVDFTTYSVLRLGSHNLPQTRLYLAAKGHRIKTIFRSNDANTQITSGRDSDTFVVWAERGRGDFGIYTLRPGKRLRPVAFSRHPRRGDAVLPRNINAAGGVVFQGVVGPDSYAKYGIYTAKSFRSRKTVVYGPRQGFTVLQYPCLNKAGVVAFQGQRSPKQEGIYTALPTGQIRAVVLNNTPEFSHLYMPSLNAEGNIAFGAWDTKERASMYFYSPSLPRPFAYLRVGDTLFGSPVTDLDYFAPQLNDHNQIAFYYWLKNGVHGIARANITLH